MLFHKSLRFVLLVPILSGFLSCSHGSVEDRLDQKLSQDSEIKTGGDVRREATLMIENSPTLTGEQKKALTSLRANIQKELSALNDETLKLRTELIRDLIEPKLNRPEVALIKKRLSDLEAKKLASLFNGVDKANSIMGREVKRNREILDRMMYEESYRMEHDKN